MNIIVSPTSVVHSNLPRCAGYVIFKDETYQEVILVKTHRNHYSFPKGKLEKGESIEEGARRETEEETGLTPDSYTLISDIAIDEYTPKGFPSVRYYLAVLKDSSTLSEFTCDSEELEEVNWHYVKDINRLSGIKLARQRIAFLAQEIAINKWDSSSYSGENPIILS